MLNFNGDIIAKNDFKLSYNNRGFKYGDSIFETVKIINGRVIFWEDHYFRLMASMRMLRMEIPLSFTLEFLENELIKTSNHYSNGNVLRARLSVFRNEGGFYTPLSNKIGYIIEIEEVNLLPKKTYSIDLFKDFYNYSGLLSTVKSNNKLINILAGIYAKENDLDNCILLNEKKGICEVINGNIFIIIGDKVKTPALAEGCLKGIIRKKVIEILNKSQNYQIEETSINPFELQKADEVFITNSIIGIQSVTHYRKKVYATKISEKIKQNLSVLEMTS